MTDEPGMTYEQMAEELELAKAMLAGEQRDHKRTRETSDVNYANGEAWKKQANELTKQLDRAVSIAEQAQAQAAELRGYIKRVHETDGESVKHFDVGFGPRPVDTMYETAFEQPRRR